MVQPSLKILNVELMQIELEEQNAYTIQDLF